jgi:hypothetical protein
MVLLVLFEKFESVQVNFPVAGHTKFGPDGMFGWLAPLLRKFDLYELEDIVTCTLGGPSRYAVQKIDPALLLDWTSYISEHVLKAVNGINARHGVLVTKNGTGATLKVRDYSNDEWEIQKQFAGPLPKFAAARLPQKPLSAAKVKDLLRQERYSPTGTLSYAHFETVATPQQATANPRTITNDANIVNNASQVNNTNEMQVEHTPINLPIAPGIVMNHGIAYYVDTPIGYRPVYVVDMQDGTTQYWMQ